MKNKLIYTLILGIFVTSFAACTKDFEAINTNPNNPTEAPLPTLLAFSLRDHAAEFYNTWGDMNEPSTYAGHLAKHSYIDEARYSFRPNVVENMWTFASRQLKNLDVAIKRAEAEGSTNMQAAALTTQSMIWIVATDRWRDLPFVDALQGDAGVISPTFTRQEDIYPVLLERLKTAAAMFDVNGDNLGGGDLLFNNDILKWKKFANSLRLRAAIRISDVNPALARQHIEEIAGNPTAYPVMETNADNALIIWPGTPPYEEPWRADEAARDDYSVADYMINTLKDLEDPRLPVYARPGSNGEFTGAPVGPKDDQISGDKSIYSRIGTRFRSNAAGFSPFMRASEIKFILAEAAAKGFNAGVTAESAYNDGVTLSLQENGIQDAAISAYLSGDGAYDGLESIHLQKWISLFKNGQEAWAESRRTDVPVMTAATGSPYPGHNRPPFRYPYPTSETQLNETNSAEFVAEVEDNFWGKQMWWDTRANVN